MPKDDSLYLGHMLDLSRKAIALVRGKNRQDFDRDETLRLALTHLLQNIGETARHVSDPFRATHPEIPWRLITGMRHRIVHDYLDVDEDIVWGTVTEELPGLVSILEMVMPKE